MSPCQCWKRDWPKFILDSTSRPMQNSSMMRKNLQWRNERMFDGAAVEDVDLKIWSIEREEPMDLESLVLEPSEKTLGVVVVTSIVDASHFFYRIFGIFHTWSSLFRASCVQAPAGFDEITRSRTLLPQPRRLCNFESGDSCCRETFRKPNVVSGACVAQGKWWKTGGPCGR